MGAVPPANANHTVDGPLEGAVVIVVYPLERETHALSSWEERPALALCRCQRQILLSEHTESIATKPLNNRVLRPALQFVDPTHSVAT